MKTKTVTESSSYISISESEQQANPLTVSGSEWLTVGKITLNDEERSILYLPNAWQNVKMIAAEQLTMNKSR